MSTCLVTGADRGLGLAIALELSRRDHDVVATMRDPSTAGDLEAAAAGEGLSVRTMALDVTDEASVARAVAATERELGPIDVLVAGDPADVGRAVAAIVAGEAGEDLFGVFLKDYQPGSW